MSSGGGGVESNSTVLYQLPQEDTTEAERERKRRRMPFLSSGYWFVWDPCGIVCAVMTYLLILYGELVVLVVLAPPFPTFGTAISVLIFTTFASLAVVAHVKAMFTDPVSFGSISLIF